MEIVKIYYDCSDKCIVDELEEFLNFFGIYVERSIGFNPNRLLNIYIISDKYVKYHNMPSINESSICILKDSWNGNDFSDYCIEYSGSDFDVNIFRFVITKLKNALEYYMVDGSILSSLGNLDSLINLYVECNKDYDSLLTKVTSDYHRFYCKCKASYLDNEDEILEEFKELKYKFPCNEQIIYTQVDLSLELNYWRMAYDLLLDLKDCSRTYYIGGQIMKNKYHRLQAAIGIFKQDADNELCVLNIIKCYIELGDVNSAVDLIESLCKETHDRDIRLEVLNIINYLDYIRWDKRYKLDTIKEAIEKG